MRILAIVTARKHSQRVPNKNFRKFRGLSLTERAVAQAAALRDRGILADFVLSTDSGYLLAQCRKYGPLDIGLRGEALSGASVKSIDVVLDVLDRLRQQGLCYDAVLILQPTSPLRTTEDISGAVSLFESQNGISLITAARIPGATINGLYLKEKNGFFPASAGHNSGTRHQDLAPVYLRNGAVFLSRVDYITRSGTIISDQPLVYEMPFARSVDLDDFEDIEVVRKTLSPSPKAGKPLSVILKREALPSVEEALDLADAYSRQIILADLFRVWLYEMRGDLSAEEHLAWTERHVYFDGVAVLADGECVNDRLMRRLRGADRGLPAKDPRVEAYLHAKIAELTADAESCIVQTDSD